MPPVSPLPAPPPAAPRRPWALSLPRVGALRRLFAPRCALCGTAAGDPLCSDCSADFVPADVHRCRVCAQRLGPATGDLCGQCLREPPAFDATIALADYVAPIDGLVIALKFGHRLEVARTLGLLLGRRIDHSAPSDAVLAVVPLAFERQRERGFNQALEVARVAAATCTRPLLPHALVRTRHRPAQEGLTRAARRSNVRGAFSVAREAEAQIAQRCVVVIDDVMTSGSTLDEVARVLKAAGAARIVNAVAARTP